MYLGEIKPGQSGSQEDKNRAAGDAALGRVLKLTPRINDKRPFQPTHKDIAKEANIVALPTSLINQLGFEGLDWTWCGESKFNSMPALYIGRPHSDRFMTTDADKATGTIEVARIVDQSEGNKKFVPIALRIAGVVKKPDSKKPGPIVALSFNPEKDYRLTEANVSFSNSEFGHGNEHQDMLTLLSKSIVTLAYSEKHPYKTAGLITPEMRKLVDTNNADTRHEFAFSFRIDPQSNVALALKPEVLPSPIGRDYSEEENREISEVQSIFQKLGYYTKVWGYSFNNSEVLEIGLEEENAILRKVAPWKVKIPLKLRSPIEKTSFWSPTETE